MGKYILLILCLILLACAVAFTVWCILKKKQGICPFCVIKQFMRKSQITMNIPDEFYDGGDSATPPMGWSSWNTFRNNIDENLILETAQALKETGLADAGYRYVNLDDCWHSSMRDENGRLQGDLNRFSSGIKPLVEKINALGLKVGLYTSNGEYTCEDLPASLGFEKTDAETFAEWGVEYFKYDFCHNKKIPSVAPLVERVEIKTSSGAVTLNASDAKLTGLARISSDKKLKTGKYIGFLGHGKGRAAFEIENGRDEEDCALTLVIKKCGEYDKYIVVRINDDYYEMSIPATKAWSPEGRYQIKVRLKQGKNKIELFNPVCTRADSSYIQYKRMGEALKNASKERKITYSICEWGRNKPAKWAWNTGNLWRTTPDILPNWRWINAIYNINLKLSEFAGPGHWNDPDMLEVGNGKLSYEENKTHFSLWCMMAAPLILGNDIRKLSGGNDDKNLLSILKNKEMIAVNQDPEGVQCVRFYRNTSFDFLIKKLSGNNFAVCIYNRKNSEKTAGFDVNSVPENVKNGKKKFTELWSGQTYEGDRFSFRIPGHGCVVIRTY